MSLPPTTFRYPFALADQPHEVQQAHIFAYNGILDLQNAIRALKSQIGTAAASTTAVGGSSSVTQIINGSNFPGLGGVNDQLTATAYTTLASDNGIFLLLGAATAVTLTLDSALATPFFFFASNFGTSTVTLTPTSGTINQPTFDVGGLYLVVFDGTNWKASDMVQLAQTFTAITHEFLTAYDAATGTFSAAQPAFTDISGTLATTQLPALVPVISFGSGAPVGSSTEGYLYFDNSGSPYHGYVFHSGAWQQFS